ncbi:MAG: T9SS type A sorting domain-containing protein [Bacteroidota bacterium]|nr:T9SS type A sorting domain-containing protein [Bacteroidota bacterium]
MIIKISTLFLAIVISFQFQTNAQQGAIFSKKVIKNFHQEAFQVAIAVNDPFAGSFRDFEGNFYVYGEYSGQGKNNKIDDIFINELNSEAIILIKFDPNYNAIWGKKIGNANNMFQLKVLQASDSLIYIFASSYENFSMGSFQVLKTTIGSEKSTFMVRLDPKTGDPINGFSLSAKYIKYSWMLSDATVDNAGNVYVAMRTFVGTLANKPDSIRFGNLSAIWKEKSKKQSTMAAIVKFDKNMTPIWLHTIGAMAYEAPIKLSYVNDELVVCGYVKINDKQWKRIYFDDELLIDVTFNSPYGQNFNGFLIKIDSNGNKKWMRPWITKYELDDSPGVSIIDMKTDPKGNIYCMVRMISDFKSKLDTTWITPTVRTIPKMIKFNQDGYVQWITEPFIARTFSEYPKTWSNSMYVDEYGNSYYSFLLPKDFQEFIVDSIKFSQPYKYGDTYWGLLKLDSEGKAVDAIFPPVADKSKKVSFDNSFQLSYVDNNGKIYHPLTIRVYQDSIYAFGSDTLVMDYDTATSRLLATWYFCWNEITPKSQLIKEYSNPSCANSNNGYIHLKVIGGASGYYLKWDHGSSTLKLDDLGSGTYIVSLYDSTSQQTTIDTFLLTEPLPLSCNIIIKDDTNNLTEGSLQLNMQGGTPPYTYQWNDPKNSTTASIDKLASGSYTVTVTDYNKCTWDTTVTINNITISIDEYLKELSIYPNPSHDGSVFIRMSNPKSKTIEVFVLDAKGQECYHTIFNANNGLHEKLTVKLKKGNYLIRIVDGKENYLRKISIL